MKIMEILKYIFMIVLITIGLMNIYIFYKNSPELQNIKMQETKNAEVKTIETQETKKEVTISKPSEVVQDAKIETYFKNGNLWIKNKSEVRPAIKIDIYFKDGNVWMKNQSGQDEQLTNYIGLQKIENGENKEVYYSKNLTKVAFLGPSDEQIKVREEFCKDETGICGREGGDFSENQIYIVDLQNKNITRPKDWLAYEKSGFSWMNENKIIYISENPLTRGSLMIGDLSDESTQVLVPKKEEYIIIGEIKSSDNGLFAYYGQQEADKTKPVTITIQKVEISTKTVTNVVRSAMIDYTTRKIAGGGWFQPVRYNVLKNGYVNKALYLGH